MPRCPASGPLYLEADDAGEGLQSEHAIDGRGCSEGSVGDPSGDSAVLEGVVLQRDHGERRGGEAGGPGGGGERKFILKA